MTGAGQQPNKQTDSDTETGKHLSRKTKIDTQVGLQWTYPHREINKK